MEMMRMWRDGSRFFSRGQMNLSTHGAVGGFPARFMEQDIVYFDLETKRTANDVGGWDQRAKMGMSLGVTYSTRLGEYQIFMEKDVDALIDQLVRADLVVGCNVVRFDYGVLMAYTIMDLPAQCRTLDLITDLETVIGHRVGLDAMASASLGVGKTAGGLDAVRWWREGRLMELAEYCCYDVKCTKLVHEYGRDNGQIFYIDKSQRKQTAVVKW